MSFLFPIGVQLQLFRKAIRNQVFSHLSSSADFRKAFGDFSHKNRKDERSQTDLAPTTMSLTPSNPQAVRPKIHEIIKISPFITKCNPRSPKSMKSKRKPRDFPRAQRVRLSAPAAGGVVSFRRLGTKMAPASLLGQKQNNIKNTQNLSLNHYGGLFSKSWFS